MAANCGSNDPLYTRMPTHALRPSNRGVLPKSSLEAAKQLERYVRGNARRRGPPQREATLTATRDLLAILEGFWASADKPHEGEGVCACARMRVCACACARLHVCVGGSVSVQSRLPQQMLKSRTILFH